MSQYRTITTNRRARRDYDILDTVEAGIVLTGTEIKSLRANRANIGDAYARPEGMSRCARASCCCTRTRSGG